MERSPVAVTQHTLPAMRMRAEVEGRWRAPESAHRPNLDQPHAASRARGSWPELSAQMRRS